MLQLLLLTTIAALLNHGGICTTTGFCCRVENLIYAATAAQISHLFLFLENGSPTPEYVENVVLLKLIFSYYIAHKQKLYGSARKPWSGNVF